MQNPSSFLNRSTAHRLGKSVKHFFNLPTKQPQLLKQQPLSQRQLFLKKAIESQYIVFVQLRPRLLADKPINIEGTIHRLDQNRYLLTRGHVNYFFAIDQLQYLARI